MDLETAHLKSVQPDRREAIPRGALLRRRAELRKSWIALISDELIAPKTRTASETRRVFNSGAFLEAPRNAPRKSHYDWTKKGDQTKACLGWREFLSRRTVC